MLDTLLPSELVDKIFFELHKIHMKLCFEIINEYVPKPEKLKKNRFPDYLVIYRPTYYVNARLTYKNVFFNRINEEEPSEIEKICTEYVLSKTRYRHI